MIGYLLPAQPDNYLNLSLKGRFDVAQKYGSYEEPNGNKNDHIAAIVYTPTPIIVTVMTRNVGDYQTRMAEIGEYLADYALELDAKAAELEAERAAEAARAEEAEARQDETVDANPAESGENPAPTEAPAPAETAAPEALSRDGGLSLRWLIPALIVLVAVLVLTFVLIGQQRRKRRAARRRAAARAAAREAAGQKRDEQYSPRH